MVYLHQRRSLRLPTRDYSRGTYLVTVCALRDGPRFGEGVGGHMRLNEVGEIVAGSWQWLAVQYAHVALDEWLVMPDHLHALIILADETARSREASTPVASKRKPLGQLIGAFKTVSTKRVNRSRNTPGAAMWQRNFWERVVRHADSLEGIRRYIRNNPAALAARTGVAPSVLGRLESRP